MTAYGGCFWEGVWVTGVRWEEKFFSTVYILVAVKNLYHILYIYLGNNHESVMKGMRNVYYKNSLIENWLLGAHLEGGASILFKVCFAVSERKDRIIYSWVRALLKQACSRQGYCFKFFWKLVQACLNFKLLFIYSKTLLSFRYCVETWGHKVKSLRVPGLKSLQV